jgi:hypothetical protein
VPDEERCVFCGSFCGAPRKPATPTQIRIAGAIAIVLGGFGVAYFAFESYPWIACVGLFFIGIPAVVFPKLVHGHAVTAEILGHADGARLDRTIELEGTFRAPAITGSLSPIPLRGRGRLVISGDGLRVIARMAERETIMWRLGTFLLAWLAAIWHAVDVGGWAWVVAIVAGPALWIALKPRRMRDTEPTTLRVPWDCVAGFQRSLRGRLVVRVVHMTPSGEIHFAPDRDTRALFASIREQLRADHPERLDEPG